MTETARAERRTPAQWAALVGELEASGQSQRAFCAERGVGQSSLRYWRGRLRERERGAREAPAATRLVAVKVLEEPPAPAGGGVVVVTSRGLRIEVAREFDPATLVRVLATLESA
jgi:hypothetical protein